jgi:hypothetical protein
MCLTLNLFTLSLIIHLLLRALPSPAGSLAGLDYFEYAPGTPNANSIPTSPLASSNMLQELGGTEKK